MFKRKTLLPDVPIYGFIGGIPETFGGRTGVCLQRANAFAESSSRDIQILTLSPAHGVDPDALTARLRQEGRIGSRVKVRNIWADLRLASASDLKSISRSGKRISLSENELLPYCGEFESEKRSDDDKVIQVDRFREDGTRVTSYRQPGQIESEKFDRRIVLFDHAGEPLAQWEKQHHLYFAWMDWIIGSEMSVLINDGSPLARYLNEYRRDNVVFVQTIHSRHSGHPGKPGDQIGPTYLPTLKNMEKFDRVAVLTEAQYNDIVDRSFGVDNVRVLPNMVVADQVKRIGRRDPGSGVMLARTSFQKRIDHAIRATVAASSSDGSISLDVYGVADDAEESLRSLINDLRASDRVALRGYDTRAKQNFLTASFTLLTSTFEGQGLALLEAMAVGCIPIAYDIKYGPADTITDGVNGFLVPDGDIEAMANRIRSLTTMSEKDLKRMRKAAIDRSRDFSPEAITTKWANMLTEAIDDKFPVSVPKGKALLQSAKLDAEGVHATVEVTGEVKEQVAWARLMWEVRKGKQFGRASATISYDGDSLLVKTTVPLADFTAVESGTIDFWIDLRSHHNPVRLRIKDAHEGLPTTFGQFELYGTDFHSLSMRVRATSDEEAN